MADYSFAKELYPKIALLKAAYSFTDRAYVHLDADDIYFYVHIEPQEGSASISKEELEQEMLAQAVRHEIYLQTKNIRELLLGRALATSLITEIPSNNKSEETNNYLTDSDILRNWFENQ